MEKKKCMVTIEWLNGKKSTFYADRCVEMDRSILLEVNGTEIHIPWENTVDGTVKYFEDDQE